VHPGSNLNLNPLNLNLRVQVQVWPMTALHPRCGFRCNPKEPEPTPNWTADSLATIVLVAFIKY